MGMESVEEAEAILKNAGVPAMVVRGFAEVADAPYITEREMIVRLKQPFAGEIETYGSPFKMSRTPGRVRGHAPLLGEHNRNILSRLLGYDDEQIDRLLSEGVIYEEDAVSRLEEELLRLESQHEQHKRT